MNIYFKCSTKKKSIFASIKAHEHKKLFKPMKEYFATPQVLTSP